MALQFFKADCTAVLGPAYLNNNSPASQESIVKVADTCKVKQKHIPHFEVP